ncbi:hypothetical protein [Sclerotium rolfsii fusarivirus 2]|uniref:Uncharacterized protein n=1 Tax=Sclerotium rolfsii fusarivirus 2 TaxID=2490824 RepID=A0AAD1EEY0_9VIRU|nr:hypothetical protein QKQ13_gp2 [Sclerotium rolfsii fusarivirus 2]AZF86099.1 hypothetical protein [Sclerotium rolfsii fusarivirus 2]
MSGGKYINIEEALKGNIEFMEKYSRFATAPTEMPFDNNLLDLVAKFVLESPDSHHMLFTAMPGGHQTNELVAARMTAFISSAEILIQSAGTSGITEAQLGVVKSIQRNALNIKKSRVYVPEVVEEAPAFPPLPAVIPDHISERSSVDIDDRNKRAKGWTKVNRKNKKTAAPRPVKAPSPPPSVADLPDDRSTAGEVNVGTSIFPVSQRRVLALVYEPPRRRPFVDGKRIKMGDVAKTGTDKVEWKEVSGEQFYDTSGMSTAFLMTARADKLIPSSIYTGLVGKASDDWREVKVYTEPEAIEAYSKGAVNAAKIAYYWAQTESELNRANLTYKQVFFDTWFPRLMDLPAKLDGSTPARRLYVFTKMACKSKNPRTSLNKALMGFKMSQLIVWKGGETRAAMIEKSRKSLTAYWGDKADDYIKAFEASPAGEFDIRPKYGNLAVKAKKLMIDAERKARADATALKNMSAQAIADFTQAMKEEDEEVTQLTEGLSWFSRLNVRSRRLWSIVTGKVLGKSEAEDRPGWRQVHESVYGHIGRIFSKATAGLSRSSRWLTSKRVISAQVSTTEEGESQDADAAVSITYEDRPWFAWAKYLTITPVKTAGGAVKEAGAGFIRWVSRTWYE